MPQFDFVREPRGEVLVGLIRAALEVCDRFTVERDEMVLDRSAEEVYAGFAPFLIECAEVSETPGSILLPPDTITLCTYRLVPESAAIIGSATDRLYRWVEPCLPQDLCFLRGTKPWLVNLAADRAGCLLISDAEADSLRVAIPGLAIRRERVTFRDAD